jgi:hypothetical protein
LEQKMKSRSIFFPLALIAAGSIWLLISTGRLHSENLWALARFWPILLIAAGLGLILRSFWAPARMIVDALAVGGAVAAILFAPQLGWTTPQWNFGIGTSSIGGGASGSGKLVTETRKLQDFTAVSIEYPADVLIQQGMLESIKIEAEDNLIPQLSSDIQLGTLVIRNKVTNWNERVNPTKSVKITIVVKDLQKIDLSSTGRVRADNLENSSLNVNLSGASSFTASGSSGDLQLSISGVGSFEGAGLVCKNVSARISGAGSATLHPVDTLLAEISGTGSIQYYGNPRVTQSISGLGSVKKIGE